MSSVLKPTIIIAITQQEVFQGNKNNSKHFDELFLKNIKRSLSKNDFFSYLNFKRFVQNNEELVEYQIYMKPMRNLTEKFLLQKLRRLTG